MHLICHTGNPWFHCVHARTSFVIGQQDIIGNGLHTRDGSIGRSVRQGKGPMSLALFRLLIVARIGIRFILNDHVLFPRVGGRGRRRRRFHLKAIGRDARIPHGFCPHVPRTTTCGTTTTLLLLFSLLEFPNL